MKNKENSKPISIKSIFEDLINFLIIGPTLFFWIIGILKFPINSKDFLISFHSGVISLLFMILYSLGYTMNLFFSIPPDIFLNYLDSLLAGLYLVLSLLNYILFKKGLVEPGLSISESLLDRLIQIEKKS